MQNVYPTLRITDYARAHAFYVDGLKFHVDWEWRHEPGLPVFLQISRDGLSFYLSEHEGDCQTGGLVHLYVADVDAWFEEVRAAGLPIEMPPTTHPWGVRSMTVTDPDDNRICIATRIDS
jgi:catechol 2,3-dioxygenase-like lactoylglutathione lyase family enzyme